MSEIAVVATIIAKPGMEEKLLEQLGTIVGPTRVERGALQYDLHRDRDDPRRFVFFERWESEAALVAHARSAHMEAYQRNAADWIENAEIRVGVSRGSSGRGARQGARHVVSASRSVRQGLE